MPGRRSGLITLGVACAGLLFATTASRRAPEAPAPGDLPAAAPVRMYDVPPSPCIAGTERGTFTPAASGDARTISFSNRIRIDTRAGEPALDPGLTLRSYGADRDGYYLVQFDGPIQPGWKSAIETAGGRVLYYVPEYAYVVRMPESRRATIAAGAHVTWTGLYQPAYKLSEGLLHAPATSASRETVTILLFANESREAVENAVRAAGGAIQLSFDGHVSLVRADLDHAGVNAVARLPQVAWIEPYVPDVFLNDQCQWVVQTNTSGIRKIWDNGITGTGQVLNSADTGVRTDHNAFKDSLIPITTWGDYPTHRKIIAYKNPGDSPDVAFGDAGGASYHGTHTAGTLIGNDQPFGTAPYDGMAKDAKLYFCDIGNSSGGLVFGTDLYTFYSFPAAGNPGGAAHVSSNSWGAAVTGAYTIEAMLCDDFTWDHPDFLLFFAAGNDGPSTMSVGSPGTAKNVVTVGGTGNGTGAGSIASFSSRGPCVDGRRKPTICTPATLTSAYGGGTTSYGSLSGTSMATPAATGALTLARQYFTDGWYPTGAADPGHAFNPSAALLKALAVNSGQNAVSGGVVPDNNIGWGRVKLDDILFFPGDVRRTAVVDNGDGLLTGEYIEYNFRVTSSTEPLKISLVWTDYLSTPSAARNLVNNLNLTATNGATTYLGNVFASGQSVTGGSPDSINVEECVWRTAPATGLWTVRVSAANVPIGPQPFALVVSGALQTASGLVTTDQTHYTANDTVRLRVEDANAGATVNVNVSSTTESTPETVVLGSTTAGLYTGTVVTTLGGAVTGDGKISVSNGDAITVTYNDALPVGTSTATAAVVLNAPVVSGVGLLSRGSTEVTLGWTTSAQATSRVYYGTTPALGSTGTLDPNLVSSHQYVVGSLSPNTGYYFDVESTDIYGNTVRDDNGGNHYRVTTSVRGDVLLVIGNTTFPDLARYRNAFNRSGWTWDEQGEAFGNSPTVGNTLTGLRSYPAVWWQVGWEQYPPFTDAAIDSITRYQNGGGRLSVFSHDVSWAFGDASSGFQTPSRLAFLNNQLHVTQNSDPTSWTQTGGTTGDPISGAWTAGITYQAFRSGGAGDLIDAVPGSGTANYCWRKTAPIPFDDCAVRWTAGSPGGSPDSSVWGGTATKTVTNCFEWSRLNAGVDDDATRADILDKTIRWLVGRAHPNVVVTSPNGGENLTGSTVSVTWTESTDGGTSVASRAIEYSDDGGQSWQLISASPGTSPYAWDVSAVPNGNTYLVRVRVIDNGSPAVTGQDASNATFTLNRPGGDTRGPVVVAGSALTTPNPVVAPGTFILSATVDDSRTGNSNIAGAEWSPGHTPAAPGAGIAMSGPFTSPSVAVRDTIDAGLFTSGYVPVWVRGRDAAGQWGPADSLTIFVNGGTASSVGGFAGGPGIFSLGPSSPNPFNPRTVIRFSLPENGPASLVVYDVGGRAVRRLAEGTMAAGVHEVTWDGRDGAGHAVASGVYFYRLEAGARSAERKMVLMK